MDRRAFLRGMGALGAASLVGCGGNGLTGAPTTSETKTTTAAANTPTTAPEAHKHAHFVQRKQDSSQVALTFHGDGDAGSTDAMLRELARLSLPATVFCIGTWLERYPKVAGRMLNEGHELGNHTYTHPTLRDLAPDPMLNEVTRCRDILTEQTGSPTRWFRPSGQDVVPPDSVLVAARSAGYETVVGFDVDPFDYRDPGARLVADRVAAGITGGSIVSLHFGHAGTVTALQDIATVLKQRQLQPTLVSTLLS